MTTYSLQSASDHLFDAIYDEGITSEEISLHLIDSIKEAYDNTKKQLLKIEMIADKLNIKLEPPQPVPSDLCPDDVWNELLPNGKTFNQTLSERIEDAAKAAGLDPNDDSIYFCGPSKEEDKGLWDAMWEAVSESGDCCLDADGKDGEIMLLTLRDYMFPEKDKECMGWEYYRNFLTKEAEKASRWSWGN